MDRMFEKDKGTGGIRSIFQYYNVQINFSFLKYCLLQCVILIRELLQYPRRLKYWKPIQAADYRFFSCSNQPMSNSHAPRYTAASSSLCIDKEESALLGASC